MKQVNFVTLVLILFFAYTNSIADNLWSTCVNIIGVTDNRGQDSSVYLTVSPAISGCNYGGINRVRVLPGTNGATGDTAKSALALGLGANLTGKKVRFYYDDSSLVCNVRIMSFSGYNGQC